MRIFYTVFRQFLREFPKFLKTGFSAEFPLTGADYYVYKSAPSVESIKLMTIIEEGQNAQLYLHYRDSNKIMIYIDCNRLKGSFD